jgi:hypothetical protein
VAVARYSDIHSIHRLGEARKSWGAARTKSVPLVIEVASSPRRPMSW